jgi:hypothetical protein
MNAQNLRERFRFTGIITLAGSAIMLTGSALWGITGTDLWAALDGGDMASYLRDAGAVKTQLVANLSFWTVGVFILGMAGGSMAALSERRWALSQAALLSFWTAVPLAIIGFLTMMVLVVLIAPGTSETAIYIARVISWVGARAEDIATVLLIGVGPLFVSLAGRGDWAPKWLLIWSYLAFFCGLFSMIVLYFPGMSKYGFIIVPVGMGWMIAAGIVLLRRKTV